MLGLTNHILQMFWDIYGYVLFRIFSEVSDISSNSFFINTYVKTHMRATGYLFGLFTGFILHYMQAKKYVICLSNVIAVLCEKPAN